MIVVFISFFNITFLLYIIGGFVLLFGIMAVICRLVTKAICLKPPRSYLSLSIKYMKRKNGSILFSATAMSLSAVFVLTIVAFVFTSAEQVTDYILERYNYNFVISTSLSQSGLIDDFLHNSDINNYYRIAEAFIYVENDVVDSSIGSHIGNRTIAFIVDPIPDIEIYQPLYEGIILGNFLAARYGLSIGSELILTLGETTIKTIVAEIGVARYQGSGFDVVISSELIPPPPRCFGRALFIITYICRKSNSSKYGIF